MMKKLFIFIGLGLVLSLGLVSIVLAQQTGAIATPLKSSDLNPTSVSGVGVATENTPTSIDASTNIKSVISYGVATINSKINILNALKTRVDASLLTDNQKGELDHAIADNINRLQALSGNLQAETDINAAKAEVKSIFVDLRISGIFKPKVNLLINLYLQENYLSKVYNQLNPTLQANISSDAATRCGNSDARQSALNQAKVIADSAYTKIVKTRDIVSGLAPEDYTNGSYRVDIATSSLAIRGIQTQLSTIRKQLLAANTYRYTYCSCDLDRNRACGANDFTIFGKDWGRTNCAMPGTKNTACTCDLNHDGRCDMIDWLIFGRDWNKGIICNNNGSCEANETPVNCPADCKITRACQGDLNKDGTVNASDWSIFQQKWGHTDCQAITGGCPCDLNVDGKCDMSDWQLFGRDWGRTDCANNSCSNQCLSGKIGSDAVNSSTGWVCKFNTTTGCWEKSTVTCTSGKIFGSNGGCIVPTCTNFTYSSWSTCSTNGVQTRTITAKTPAGCTGGKPELLSQKCTPGAQTNECSSGQTGCSTSTVAWTCSLSSTGKWMKNEEPCENSPKCYQGKCVNSQQECFYRTDSSSDSNSKCCAPYVLKSNGYNLIEPKYNSYTCCLVNECAYKGACEADGYVDLSRQSSFNLPYYKCTNGQWMKQTCMDYKQRSFSADQSPQCCEGLELKPEIFSDGEYKAYSCCKPGECALKGCWGNGLRVPGYYDNTGTVVSYVCNNGTWTKDSNYNPASKCLLVRRAGSSSAYLQSISDTSTHSDAKCCDGYILKKTLNVDPAHQEPVYSCCAENECSDNGTCRTSGYLMQASDTYSYKCESGNWVKQGCFSKQQFIGQLIQGICCAGLVAVTDNRMLNSGLRQSVCCAPGECASYGNCLANGIVWPEIDDEIFQNPEGAHSQRTKCENGIWKVVK